MREIKRKLWIYCILGIVLSSCGGVNFTQWRFPYMYPVQQGNYINQQQLQQLKLGMSKEQVAFVLGHPVSQFMFDASIWQYVFQQYNNDKLTNSYIVSIKFDTNEQLVKIESAGEVFNK